MVVVRVGGDGFAVVVVAVVTIRIKGGDLGAVVACWLERRTRDRKVASSNPGRSGGRVFFSRVNFVC